VSCKFGIEIFQAQGQLPIVERQLKCVRYSRANDKPEFVDLDCSRQAGHGLRSRCGPVTQGGAIGLTSASPWRDVFDD